MKLPPALRAEPLATTFIGFTRPAEAPGATGGTLEFIAVVIWKKGEMKL